jgi:hypothetical protein
MSSGEYICKKRKKEDRGEWFYTTPKFIFLCCGGALFPAVVDELRVTGRRWVVSWDWGSWVGLGFTALANLLLLWGVVVAFLRDFGGAEPKITPLVGLNRSRSGRRGIISFHNCVCTIKRCAVREAFMSSLDALRWVLFYLFIYFFEASCWVLVFVEGGGGESFYM